ncbi:MAG: exopolysaccharide biosynthesis polyprenyl glycosylphosphotransferase [Acidobacteria bacterium]|nr:exopolysaccharide biosynthesis polyprenyl glycosylphosphotransferase [Acidobacteriota bacterium]
MSVATTVRVQQTVRLGKPGWMVGLFVIADILALEIALLAGCVVRWALLDRFPIEIGPAQYRGLALGILVVPLMYWLGGLYPGFGMNPVERLRRRTYATAITFSFLVAWDYLVQDRQWSRGILLASALFAFVVPPILDEIARFLLVRRGRAGLSVLVLGAGKTGHALISHMLEVPTLGLHPAIVLDDDPAKWGTTVHSVPVVGPLSMASQYQGQISTAMIALPSLRRERTAEIISQLNFQQVIVIPDLYGIQSLWVTARDIGGVLGLEIRNNLQRPSNHLLKRCVDLVIGSILLVAFLPLMAIAAVAIQLVDRGSPIFRQKREGRDGNPLTVLKLRTMYQDAEVLLEAHLNQHPDQRAIWTQFFKLRHDPRILPVVGRFLRRFSLDELPQLWQVVKGEMSLVGPRPFPSYHLTEFSQEFRRLRRSVTPGLTGLWQVSARSNGALDVQQSLDTYYIRNWSPWLDLHILVRTVGVVLLGKGAY